MTSPNQPRPSAPGRKTVFSGMRPTGKLHLGHLVGALDNWVRLQDTHDCVYSIVDWHALMGEYENSGNIRPFILEMAADWLACGIDPERSIVFLQSDVPEHLELEMFLACLTPLGWLERVPTYKEQRENIKEKDLGTYGFLGYPVLQSADILMYQAHYVPVGEDQVPHIELTREIARRFNQFYSLPRARRMFAVTGAPGSAPQPVETAAVFPEPQPLLTPAAKLPGTDGRKMSKSYGNAILLTDPEPVVRQKLKTMVTDPARIRRSDPGNPDICPVGDLHKIFSDKETIAKVWPGCKTAGIGCIECKQWLADHVVKVLAPIQERRRKYEDNPRLAWDILEDGTRKAKTVAAQTMQQVREAMHMSQSFELPEKTAGAK